MADRPNPLAAALALAIVLAGGGYGTWFWLARDRGPDPSAFPVAAAVIREGWQPRDILFLVPFYATRAREQLGDLAPLAVRDPLREDLDVHERAWVFGLFGEAEALRPRMQAAGLELVRSETPAPGITVDLWKIGARRTVVYDFLEHLRDARVWHEKDGARTACAQWTEKNGQGAPMGRWACPYDAEWFYVAPEYHRMGDHLRLCLWAHPPTQGRLVISYPDVPMTGELRGRAGHTLNSSVYARAPVSLDVELSSKNPQRFTFELAEHFRPFVLQTPETGTATVTFAVSSPDAGANHFCFVADMRDRNRSAQ